MTGVAMVPAAAGDTGQPMTVVAVSTDGSTTSVTFAPEASALLVGSGASTVLLVVAPVRPGADGAAVPDLGATSSAQGTPVAVRLSPLDASGQRVTLAAPDAHAAGAMVTIALPGIASAPASDRLESAGTQTWLQAVYEVDGSLLGYAPVPAIVDPETGAISVQVPLASLNVAADGSVSAVFVPAIVTPSFVQNFDPDVHFYSGPTGSAVDLGTAADQFTTFEVLGPQVGGRLPVRNTATGDEGWIDAAGVGPA